MAAKNGFMMVSNEVFTIIEVCGVTDSLAVFLAIRKHGIHSFPSVKELCRLTKLSERQVRKMIGLLEHNGFIHVERPVKGKGTSQYTSLFEPGAQYAPLQEVHRPPAPDAPPSCNPCTTPVQDVHPELQSGNQIYLTKTNEQKPMNNSASRFGEFLAVYPVKQKLLAASQEWAKLNPTDELIDTIIQAVENQKKSEAWQEKGGKYIPAPANWLRDQRWTDEVRKPIVGGLDVTAETELDRIRLRREARNERHNAGEVLRPAQSQITE